ncbi:MAG: adenine methylase [Petrotoga sp.]|jgi:DNA adenine methylase|nr:adenine methylase [Petrotoga sp.]
MRKGTKNNFIRYPGGKQRILNYILPYLPKRDMINGRYFEPFLGSGSVFFALNPRRAALSDINQDLIDLFRGIRRYPVKVWEIYKSFPETKEGYYRIRSMKVEKLGLAFRAARILYLNRTCFKGMWRHNADGEFNVGYGGQDRRWVIDKDLLIRVSRRLKRVILKCADFEEIINMTQKGDFIYADPPYRPGARELIHAHYRYGKFLFSDYQRLAETLHKASGRGVRWAMTISSHPEILALFKKCYIIPIPKGTGKKPGILINNSGEVLICNYKPGVTL